MSCLSASICSGVCVIGGVLGYPSDQIYEEVACIASEFHWSLEEIINLEHRDRYRWVTEVKKLRQYRES